MSSPGKEREIGVPACGISACGVSACKEGKDYLRPAEHRGDCMRLYQVAQIPSQDVLDNRQQ